MAVAVRDMSEKDLQEQLKSSYRELMQLRFSYALARSLSNPARVRQLKRMIARILTIQRERGLTVGVPNLATGMGKHAKKGAIKKRKK